MKDKTLEEIKDELDKIIDEELQVHDMMFSSGFAAWMRQENNVEVVAIVPRGLQIDIEYLSQESKKDVETMAKNVAKKIGKIINDKIKYRIEEDYYAVDYEDEPSYTILMDAFYLDVRVTKAVGKFAKLLR